MTILSVWSHTSDLSEKLCDKDWNSLDKVETRANTGHNITLGHTDPGHQHVLIMLHTSSPVRTMSTNFLSCRDEAVMAISGV